jgi:hypothetical protein
MKRASHEGADARIGRARRQLVRCAGLTGLAVVVGIPGAMASPGPLARSANEMAEIAKPEATLDRETSRRPPVAGRIAQYWNNWGNWYNWRNY